MKTHCTTRTDITEMLAQTRKDGHEAKKAAGGMVTDGASDWLAAQYLAAAREKLESTPDGGRWMVLREMAMDWTMLRRCDQSAGRLEMDREQLVWKRANCQLEKEKEFRQWIKRPEVRDELFPKLKGGLPKKQ